MSKWAPPKKVKQKVIKKIKKCIACGSKRNLTVDHIQPRSQGGRNAQWNLTVLCKDCNRIKGDRTMNWLLYQLRIRKERRLCA